MLGLDPDPWSIRSLKQAYLGRFREEWDRAALICAVVANCHRTKEVKPTPFEPADFHPLDRSSRRHSSGTPLTKDLIRAQYEAWKASQ